MNKLKNNLQIHRYRNGRPEINYFSRELRPKYTLVELDGKFYDRQSLEKFINDKASNTVPESLRALNTREKNNVKNKTPYRIYGRSKTFQKNIS